MHDLSLWIIEKDSKKELEISPNSETEENEPSGKWFARFKLPKGLPMALWRLSWFKRTRRRISGNGRPRYNFLNYPCDIIKHNQKCD